MNNSNKRQDSSGNCSPLSKRGVRGESIIMGIDPGSNVMGYGVIRCVGKQAELVAMGIIDMRKESDPYLKLGHIYARVTGIIDEYLPDEIAIEAPFYGKNVQSMLKLGRAQGVAIAAAIQHSVPIHEYQPTKIKMAITGTGGASKEQVAGMLQRILKIEEQDMPKFMDATDALGAAYCHFLQITSMGRLTPNPSLQERGTNRGGTANSSYKGWKDFVNKNQQRICKPPSESPTV